MDTINRTICWTVIWFVSGGGFLLLIVTPLLISWNLCPLVHNFCNSLDSFVFIFLNEVFFIDKIIIYLYKKKKKKDLAWTLYSIPIIHCFLKYCISTTLSVNYQGTHLSLATSSSLKNIFPMIAVFSHLNILFNCCEKRTNVHVSYPHHLDLGHQSSPLS